MFNVGPGEIALVFGLALLLFGPKKLPELGRALGQGLGNFKKSLTDAQHEMKQAMEIEDKSHRTEEAEKTSSSSQ
ncbi:MAG TPA: twin-arginine translocase TatA/TatE family subunit [Candidatus Obscuribacterales bacterium]